MVFIQLIMNGFLGGHADGLLNTVRQILYFRISIMCC